MALFGLFRRVWQYLTEKAEDESILNITFICTGNTCRSPMAQALFTQMAQDSGITFTASSAGLAAMPGQPAAEYAVKACKALGADLSAHRSKSLLQEDLASTDLFVVMTMQHAQALMKLGVAKNKIYILYVPDPFGGNLETYTQCCKEIRRQLATLLELIKKQEQKRTDE